MEVEMSENAEQRWQSRVEETFNALRYADRDAQEQACKSIEKERGGVEAGKKLRELFEAEHVKVRRLVDKANAVVAKLPEPKKAEAKAEVVEPKLKVVKAAREIVDWKLRPNGGWEYLLKGETGYRRGFGEPPKHLAEAGKQPEKGVVVALKPKQQEKPEPEPEEVKPKLPGPRVAPLAFQHSKNPTGIPASLENAMTAIGMLGAECRYDVFHDRIIVKGHECGVRGDAHENLENVTLKIRQAVLERFGSFGWLCARCFKAEVPRSHL
jgi:hypothetical protein